MRRIIPAALIAGTIAILPHLAAAQQTTIGVPNRTVGSSFYENVGVQWGVKGNGWFFNFGGAAQPPFGGFNPNGGATFGFGGPGGFLNISAGQGANTTFSSQTPMVTMPNGGFATFNDQTLRPFVTGFVPVVGGAPPAFSSVLEERLHRLQAEGPAPQSNEPAAASGSPAPAAASSAERGDASVAEIKARKAAEKADEASVAAAEAEGLVEKARGALADGKPAVAKIFLQMAARRASGEQRAEILRQLEGLSNRPTTDVK
jgi:hypothetical protein